MAKSLALEIPNVSEILAKTKINEALGKIYDETDWSFQTKTGGWYVAGLRASTGTVTINPFDTTVTGDAVATAAWAALSGRPLLTELQFRNPSYNLYDIVAYDPAGAPPFATLTLDRPWAEPTKGAGQQYYIYQAYFPVPVTDFRKFIDISDFTDNDYVDFWSYSQDDLSLLDAQRLNFGPGVPTYAVPFDTDSRPNSATLGNVRYEIWPHNLSTYQYSFVYRRRGPQLVANQDTILYPLTEELVMWRAKEVLYQYKEAQKGEQVQRGSGADFRFLAEAAAKEYNGVLRQIRAIDANLHNTFKTFPKRRTLQSADGYSTERTGQLNVGRFTQ